MFHLQKLQKEANLNIMPYGGATGESDTTSGRIALAPTPDQAYQFRIHFNFMPAL